jgi:23S rRNA (cytidine1920-2'-O)/16S rRNA (cytidine1409-2'-O)-methyltransferase
MKQTALRLDQLLVKKGLIRSRQRAQALILAGKVLVDGQKSTKAGTRVPETAHIEVKGEDMPYVSRGGIKLEAALQGLEISVKGWRCLDVGASTGGFTDCLLQHGALHVIAVDVGYGQLHWRLRSDPRVRVIERTNVRYMEPTTIPEPMDLICIDVSFISLRKVVPNLLQFMKPSGKMICLIKPQFEVQKDLVGKQGVVRDPALHHRVLEELTGAFYSMNLHRMGLVPSPILGPKGNQEYLMLLEKS